MGYSISWLPYLACSAMLMLAGCPQQTTPRQATDLAATTDSGTRAATPSTHRITHPHIGRWLETSSPAHAEAVGQLPFEWPAELPGSLPEWCVLADREGAAFYASFTSRKPEQCRARLVTAIQLSGQIPVGGYEHEQWGVVVRDFSGEQFRTSLGLFESDQGTKLTLSLIPAPNDRYFEAEVYRWDLPSNLPRDLPKELVVFPAGELTSVQKRSTCLAVLNQSTNASPEEVMGFYARHLRAQGWQLILQNQGWNHQSAVWEVGKQQITLVISNESPAELSLVFLQPEFE